MNISLGVTALLGSILAKCVISDYNDYLFVYLTGSGLALISLVCGIFFKVKKFEYSVNEVRTPEKNSDN